MQCNGRCWAEEPMKRGKDVAPSDLIGSIISAGVFIQQLGNWRVAREQVGFQNGADLSKNES